jgi:hypothetical protein
VSVTVFPRLCLRTAVFLSEAEKSGKGSPDGQSRRDAADLAAVCPFGNTDADRHDQFQLFLHSA